MGGGGFSRPQLGLGTPLRKCTSRTEASAKPLTLTRGGHQCRKQPKRVNLEKDTTTSPLPLVRGTSKNTAGLRILLFSVTLSVVSHNFQRFTGQLLRNIYNKPLPLTKREQLETRRLMGACGPSLEFFHRSRAHRIPPHPHLPLGASPCRPLPLLPPQPAPPPLRAQQAGNTSGS